MPAFWLDIGTAATLLGCSRRYIERRARAGAYGKTKRERFSNITLISSRALELAACRIFSDEHLAAALKGERNLWRFADSERPELGGQPLDFVPSPEMIAASVATTRHEN